MNNIPFYYEVKFKFIAYDEKNNFEIKSFVRQFVNKEPISARVEAFEAFDDYITWIDQHGRIERTIDNNLEIIEPEFVSDRRETILQKLSEIPEPSEKTKESYLAYIRSQQEIYDEADPKFLNLDEEILVELVIQAEEITINNVVFEKGYRYPIHKVSSIPYTDEPVEEDIRMDNLEFELKLYDYFNFDTLNLRETVEFDGYWHQQSEDQDDYKNFRELVREIIKVPYNWPSPEEQSYNNTVNEETTSYKPIEHKRQTQQEKYEDIIKTGESNEIEFKPTLLYNFKTQKAGISVKFIIAKTICGFLNSKGGILFIGVKDNGQIQGLDYDYSILEGSNKKDKILLEIDSLISWFLNISLMPFIETKIMDFDGKDVLILTVWPAKNPVFLKQKRDGTKSKHFFNRLNASTHEIRDIEDIIDYIFNKNWA